MGQLILATILKEHDYPKPKYQLNHKATKFKLQKEEEDEAKSLAYRHRDKLMVNLRLHTTYVKFTKLRTKPNPRKSWKGTKVLEQTKAKTKFHNQEAAESRAEYDPFEEKHELSKNRSSNGRSRVHFKPHQKRKQLCTEASATKD